MKIAIGNDHTGVELKNIVKEYLESMGHEVVNFGTDTDQKSDYPEFGKKVAMAIVNKEVDKGVLICGTGVGISISANKVKGIRACVCSEPYTARMTVRHNNANIIAFGSRVVGPDMAKMIVEEFFKAEYEGGRHQKRVELIED